MRGIFCRGPRLELVAGLGIALAMSPLSVAASHAQGVSTTTTLTSETRDQGGHTQATVAVTVNGEDGLPAAGAVAIDDQGRQLAGVALNAKGQASVVLDLPGGDHLLSAVYAGDASHRSSASEPRAVSALASGIPDFQISVAPLSPATFPLTLTPGEAGTLVVSVTPLNAAALTGPMFVTLSCSGLSDLASCTATPENVEIQPSTTTAPTSSMVIQTYAASTTRITPPSRPGQNSAPIVWAFLLPGALGLGGLAWGARRRSWIQRLSVVGLLSIVTLLGTTGCNPRYYYENHGPLPNPPTPAGTYTIKVTGQSSNGITATTHSTSFVLTVK